MNKKDLIVSISKKTGITQKDVGNVLRTFQDVVFDAVKDDERVRVFDGVVLQRVYKEEHECTNPSTLEKMIVPGKFMPKCKFGKAIKEAIN